MDLFEALEAALGQLPIIAEDLGELFPSVRKLLADSTFPGMKVLQFAFSGGDNEYLPHNHVKNSVVYPAPTTTPPSRPGGRALPPPRKRPRRRPICT